ncbi:MAG TPA: ABC transporter permease subunit [Bryobacteraceae bacterium]
MAVYKRGYEPYSGPLTPEWSRFLIIARAASRRLFESRFLITFLAVCCIYPIFCVGIIYLPYNAAVADLLGGRNLKIFAIDTEFFLKFMAWQGTLAYMLAGFLGPGMVAGDLANNALPLYFCRPFSRTEYVLGKMSILAILISCITWVPGLLLFAFKAYMAGFGWFRENWWMAVAIFAGSWVWIVTLCMIALAMSAWVKWRIAAGALIFGIFFVAAGFGQAINGAMGISEGRVLNIAAVIGTIWSGLFGGGTRAISLPLAWAALFCYCGACYYLLSRKLKAYHVERS